MKITSFLECAAATFVELEQAGLLVEGLDLSCWGVTERGSLFLAILPQLDYLPVNVLEHRYAFQLGKLLLRLLLVGLASSEDCD